MSGAARVPRWAPHRSTRLPLLPPLPRSTVCCRLEDLRLLVLRFDYNGFYTGNGQVARPHRGAGGGGHDGKEEEEEEAEAEGAVGAV